MSRKLERIRAFCEADPTNAFAWYSLAMELKKAGAGAALDTFAKIREEHPRYLPNYYHYAATLAEEGEVDQARTIYEEGIALAKELGDGHAQRELEEALELL